MRLGDGFNSINDKEANQAVFVPPGQPLKESEDKTYTQEELIGKTVEVPYYPGKIKVRKVTDLAELREEVKASAGLAAKFGDLGLTLDVSARGASRFDAQHVYYLLEIESTVHTTQLAAVPRFKDQVLKQLGLLSDAGKEPVQITDEQLQGFYRDYGTHYVDEVRRGRRIYALIKFDGTKLVSESAVKATAGINATPVASAQASVEHVLSKKNQQAVLNISITTDGYDTSRIEPPTSLEDLKRIIKAVADTDIYSKEPAIISYGFKSYESIFRAAGLCIEKIDDFTSKVDKTNDCLDKLYKLHAKAVALYCKRDFHENMLYEKGHQDIREKIEAHPYTQRVTYLFSYLKLLIKAIEHLIATLNGCHLETHLINAVIAQQTKLYNAHKKIHAELIGYADSRLVAFQELSFPKEKKELDFTQLALQLPPEAAFLYMVVLKKQLKPLNLSAQLPDLEELISKDVTISPVGASEAIETQRGEELMSGDWVGLEEKKGFLSCCCSPPVIDTHTPKEPIDSAAVSKLKLGVHAKRQSKGTDQTITVQFFAEQRCNCVEKKATERPALGV